MDAPAVAVSNDGKKIAVAWMDMRAGRGDRDVQWTLGVGGKFAPEATVHDTGTGIQGHPSLVVDKEGVGWCAWEDGRGGPNSSRIFAADSKTRKNIEVTEESEGKCGYPSLAACQGKIGVVYECPSGIAFRVVPAP